MVGPADTPDPMALRRAERMKALRAEALALLVAITRYCQKDIPADASWGDIEFQADVNRRLRDLRDQVLQLGEYAPPAGPGGKPAETN